MMMAKNVMISVRGEQYFDGVDPDETVLLTEGSLEKTEEGWRITYEESELTGMTGTVTTFDIVGAKVILSRRGTVNSQMVFEEGQQHVSLYETPYGTMTIDICTSKLEKTMDREGGDMEIRYTIAVEHRVTGKNCFKISVREK